MAITHLTADQVKDVLAPSKRYEAEAYREVFNSLSAKVGDNLAHVESAFPGVKPAHVAFMLKGIRGDDKTVVVDSHAVHGVCLIRVGVKPAARTRKPASQKPAAVKPASRPKKRTAAAKK